ncbi:DUF397 domain-containing protein [Kitasatospora sp. NPDC094019]|uniref:DUF397 domain-containing protein n=1 Tax=Kitasatospora sp. NPDC094019 TaxID=3364091 RepID=UPI00381D3068
MTLVAWRKSSYSNNGGECVEVATDHAAAPVSVRDSKDPSGPTLVFPVDAWRSFVAGLQAGDFPNRR